MPFIDKKLACSCFYFWTSFIAFCLLAIEITDVFMFLILLAGPALSYWLICAYSIPPPEDCVVKEILGTELTGELFAPEPMLLSSNKTECTDNTNEFVLKAIAHRFAGIEAPENSMQALDTCFENGAVAVEFDLVLTADGVPIIFHDATLERVTNVVGEIANMKWDDIKALDISVNHPFHKKFVGSHIPLFEDIIKKCMEYDLRIIIDVKDERLEVAQVIVRAYEKYPKLYKRALVSSFNGLIIYQVRSLNPAIVCSMAWRPYIQSLRVFSLQEEQRVPYYTFLPLYFVTRLMDHISAWIFHNIAYNLIGFSAVLLNKDVITAEVVLYWRARNVRVYAWTVNNPLEKLHLTRNLGVGYFTDTMLGNGD
ncbi:hypothetical protein O3M35_011571 [Rhynocoris fuscipes]|uniref:GP-PDE domain-containing protein n=1 Tax=Rhynocoris fuscipes TaxID=488301 RepID=A0AAW1D2V7_9HEMI